MLHAFLAAHRDEILAATVAKIVAQRAPRSLGGSAEDSLPAFYDVLVDSLRRGDVEAERQPAELERSARRHGVQRHRAGYSVSEVVHDYGSMCQSIMEVADKEGEAISAREYQIMNQVLDDGIAESVTQFEGEHDASAEYLAAERLGFLAHELRNALQGAALSFQALRTGQIPIQGRTGDLIERSHRRLRDLIALLVAHVRLGAGQPLRREQLQLKSILEEAVAFGVPDAERKQVRIRQEVGGGVDLMGDRNLLHSVVTNLVQNAIKFSRAGGTVDVRGRREPDGAVSIEVEDECGGLAPGAADSMFKPFAQASADKTGLGLGLSIAREIVEAHGGTIAVRDLPGKGCIVTVALPET